MSRVLVTRPQPGAARTAARLSALGFEPVVLPLTRIEPLELRQWPAAMRFVAAAVASANAVRHAPPGLLAEIASLPVYAVGERTGTAARQAGLSVADTEAGNAEGLVRRLTRELAPGTAVLILCGQVRRSVLEDGLARAGLQAEIVETYGTVPLSPPPAVVQTALQGVPLDAVLLYSAFAAEEFMRLVERAPAAGLIEDATVIAISGRVAERLPETMRERVLVAAEPNEEAMLSLLAARI